MNRQVGVEKRVERSVCHARFLIPLSRQSGYPHHYLSNLLTCLVDYPVKSSKACAVRGKRLLGGREIAERVSPTEA
jgi:hypothetical protein